MSDGFGLAWLPLTSALLIPSTFLITYVWSVLEDHVEPDFPYISSTGAFPPESCFFAQMLNIVALLLGVTVWVRHKQIEDHCSKTVTIGRVPGQSRVAAWLGYSAAAGISMVANFQSINIITVHMVGASLAFGVGTVYLWIQGVLSWSLVPYQNSVGVAVLRLVMAGIATAMICTTITLSILHSQSTSYIAYWSVLREWRRERTSWRLHISATVAEWVLAGAFVVFLFTLIPEFKRITVATVRVETERDRRQVKQRDDSRVSSTDTVQDIR
ncbi:hypothetical protein Pcinc_010991 [Petrolisthes cinctipes]|uniref:CWH43-like N-terminal domain-containing protein n=1 Tax=Petrolisthes cinctipes TaxID=88211 RepID=A0AAE1KUW1_PETCI|nr:hypothetical protein Pcinc_010991 [Petrolisthes cinctipes]